MHPYANRNEQDWFPKLPSYTAFIQRLLKVSDVFAPLLEIIIKEQEIEGCNDAWLIDLLKVALASPRHRFKAKVAPELADAGYCSTKKLYYYGVRVHVVGCSQSVTKPRPEYIGITGASHNDGKIFEQIRPLLYNNEIYGDKAYKLPDEGDIWTKQARGCIYPHKKTQRTNSFRFG